MFRIYSACRATLLLVIQHLRRLLQRSPARPNGDAATAAKTVRIFTAGGGHQLLVIQHLRTHLQLPKAREFLVWHSTDKNPIIENFMERIISTARFADVLDIRNFESLRPRRQGAVSWWFESVRRLRRDATTVRHWMAENNIADAEVELWTDEPISFNVSFLRGLLANSRHVKLPHCFEHEHTGTLGFKQQLEAEWAANGWAKSHVFRPWQRWASGVDFRMERVAYERAYTFDRPSCWAESSIDVSDLISLPAFQRTYDTLPAPLRREHEDILGPIIAARRPLVLLLLFGLDPQSRQTYQESVARIFRERGGLLMGCSLAVKGHPGSRWQEEELFFDWLQENVPATIFPIRTALNLELMLPQLRPDYILAGACGALPIVIRLQIGHAVGMAEIFRASPPTNPHEQQWFSELLSAVETW